MKTLAVIFVAIGCVLFFFNRIRSEQKKQEQAEQRVVDALCDSTVLDEAGRFTPEMMKSVIATNDKAAGQRVLNDVRSLCGSFDNALAGVGARQWHKERVLGKGGRAAWERMSEKVIDRCPGPDPMKRATGAGVLASALLLCQVEAKR